MKKIPDMPLLKDKYGIILKPDDIVLHNLNQYYVKYSENQVRWILRVVNDNGMNWRDLEWFERCAKYCTISGKINNENL